ncbi:MAG: hypothetical protein LBF24_01450, partial [Puniceicoccales bacterium]|nr:hypothetical protein [Puniceicoccales bacterium]
MCDGVLMDPMLADRLRSLAEQEAGVSAVMRANVGDKQMAMMCFTELRGIRGERAALHMVRRYHLGDFESGKAVAVALEAYYSSPHADLALWEKVTQAIGIFVDEAAALSEQRITQEKVNTKAAVD